MIHPQCTNKKGRIYKVYGAPKGMWMHNLNPTLLHLGPLEIRWYGLVYVLGFLMVGWWLQYAHKQGKIDLSKQQISDLVFYIILGVLIGARLFMIFWQPQTYLYKPWHLLYIWQGGMSFHGGLVGIIVAAWWWCKKHKVNFWQIADLMAIPGIFALAIGRIANFINGELWGRAFNGNWCVNFKNTGGGDVCRHPSTLYAAGKRFLVFGWLLWLHYQKQFKPGFIFWNFVLFEGLGRVIVDFYRENALYYGFSLGQWFSLLMVLTSLWMLRNYKEDWKRIF
jgi:phosphatidylglycerol---prolipoprotein diacylglyceryl transferase